MSLIDKHMFRVKLRLIINRWLIRGENDIKETWAQSVEELESPGFDWSPWVSTEQYEPDWN